MQNIFLNNQNVWGIQDRMQTATNESNCIKNVWRNLTERGGEKKELT